MKLTKRRILVLVLLLLGLLVLATCSFTSSRHSGNMDDAYVEEPLPESSSKPYAAYLALSNTYTDKLLSHQFTDVYNAFSDKLQADTSPDALRDMYMNHVIEKFGMPIEYKPMQWWFEERTGLFSSRLVVRKLVRHDRGMVEYSFTFTPSDAAKKLHGVFFGQSVTVKMSLRPR